MSPATTVQLNPAPGRRPDRLRPDLVRLIPDGTTRVAVCVRLSLLLLAGLVGLAEQNDLRSLVPMVLVFALAGAGLRRSVDDRARLGLTLSEAVVAAAGIAVAGQPHLTLLICLPASGIGAALAAGYVGALAATGSAAAVLLLGRLAHTEAPGAAVLSSASAQWTLVALVTSLLASRIGELGPPEQTPDQRYAEAHRLLGQLRSVTRGMPGSLDPGSVARELLEACVEVADCEYGAVLLNVGGDQLVPLALHGYHRVPWRASLTSDGPIQRAWFSGARVVDKRSPDTSGNRTGSTLLVLPMVVGDSRVGVVALESRKEGTLEHCQALDPLVAEYALPLESAALFDELRISAAAEERTRLAREMHDGIAQDLAFLGYELDGLTATLRAGSADEGLHHARQLRTHMTSLIRDLRLSLSDLRSSIGPGRGLGAALSEYARSAGTSSGITVHLTLTEGSTRLPATVEVQLLRIAHEAVNRARRRAGATNLWVSLSVDPPSAVLVVEDDSPEAVVLPPAAGDTGEMRARAEKIGGHFSLGPRTPRGSRLQVSVEGRPR